MKLSIIIPHCNEYQNLFMTVQNIAMQVESDQWLDGQVEIIVVDNLSEDIEAKPLENRENRFETIQLLHRKNVVEFLPKQWLSQSGMLRIIEYTDDQSLWKTRQAGLDVACGEYILFSDAHVLHAPGAFTYGIETLDQNENIGELHGAQRYFFQGHDSTLYQYELTLDENFWGRWTSAAPNYVNSTDPFKIPMSSQATVFYRKADLEHWGRAPRKIGIYGGDEAFMSMRTWMMNKEVWSDPRIRYFHLADTRGYRFNNRDFIRNTLLVTYLLGGDVWLNKLYHRYRKSRAPQYYAEVDWACGVSLSSRGEHEEIMGKVKHRLDDVLALEPWSVPPTSITANSSVDPDRRMNRSS